MTKAITVSEIPKILDEAFASGEPKNLLFTGEMGVGKRTTIKNWFKRHPEAIPFGVKPTYFYEEEKGLSKKTDRRMYGDDELEMLQKSPAIFFNYLDKAAIPYLKSIILERKTTNFAGDIIDLSNIKLFVTTTLLDNGKYNSVACPEDVYELFDTYIVDCTIAEFKDYYLRNIANDIERCKGLIESEAGEKNSFEDDIEELMGREKLCKYLTSSPVIHFEYTSAYVFNPETLAGCLDWSDGTKDDFIYSLKDQVSQSIYDELCEILKDYED